MSGPDPPTRPVSPSQEGSAKAKTKVSMVEYRSRQLQQEATQERVERDRESERLSREGQHRQRESIEAQKLELACLHEIEIQQAEIARIKYEQEQLRLQQEHVREEQKASFKTLTSQTLHTPVVFGSHTPCYDKHGQELDYHDDVPATSNSQEWKNWDKYLCQHERDTNLCSLQDASGRAASLEEEARILQGTTMKSTASEEAILFRDEEMPTVDMRQFLAGLETLTPAMLSKLSAHIEHLCQLVTPLVSAESTRKESPSAPPSDLPAIPTVANPMQQAILKVAGNLGTSPTCQRTPTRPPGDEETTRATAILVEQMSVKAPGAPFHENDQP